MKCRNQRSAHNSVKNELSRIVSKQLLVYSQTNELCRYIKDKPRGRQVVNIKTLSVQHTNQTGKRTQ